jgi:hypothetical protein
MIQPPSSVSCRHQAPSPYRPPNVRFHSSPGSAARAEEGVGRTRKIKIKIVREEAKEAFLIRAKQRYFMRAST